MPEASVNEYCDPALGKCNVWADQLVVDANRIVLSETQAQTVERRAKCNFGLSVAATDAGHVS